MRLKNVRDPRKGMDILAVVLFLRCCVDVRILLGMICAGINAGWLEVLGGGRLAGFLGRGSKWGRGGVYFHSGGGVVEVHNIMFLQPNSNIFGFE